MKRYAIIVICILLYLPAQAQIDPIEMNPPTPSSIFRLSFISPKLAIEFAPADFFTLTAGFWLYTSLWTTNEYNQQIYDLTISPSFTFQPKYYFNLADRQAKGKRTDYYSGWFVGIPFAIRFSDLRYSLGATIGFQCTFGKRWFWNFDVGPGFSFYDSRFHFAGAGTVGFGVILNKM
jgi:hypothetical protein